MSILIAEDETISNLWLKTLLTKWGYEVISTRNGSEAWEILSSDGPPEIAILDWEMPEMKGIEVCEKVKKELQNTNTYIILLTGRDLDEDVAKGLEAGADDFIKKPFTNEELRAKLNLGKKKLKMWSLNL
ncbi:response regulator [Methanosarcina sp. Mfa9]|uniref:response regulator n=1 Tax=Methanosarcina sp. Mfa9 TaxID=3439063 RepID=UPI003F864ABB